ncbi:MAG: hypothetical protein WHV66_06520 [Anaerolineales bacterium]
MAKGIFSILGLVESLKNSSFNTMDFTLSWQLWQFDLRVFREHAIIMLSHQEARRILIVKKLLCQAGVELADREVGNPKDMLNPIKINVP